MQFRTRSLWSIVLLAALVVAGCSSTPAASQAGGGGGGGQGQPSIAIPSIAIPSVAIGGGGGGGGGGSGTDVEAVAKALVPPNSSEVTKTTAQDTSFAIYVSTDSLDSLKSFYEGAIPRAGMQILSTTTSNGGIAWVIATDAGGSFGGAVSVFPTGDGKTTVQVTVGKS